MEELEDPIPENTGIPEYTAPILGGMQDERTPLLIQLETQQKQNEIIRVTNELVSDYLAKRNFAIQMNDANAINEIDKILSLATNVTSQLESDRDTLTRYFDGGVAINNQLRNIQKERDELALVVQSLQGTNVVINNEDKNAKLARERLAYENEQLSNELELAKQQSIVIAREREDALALVRNKGSAADAALEDIERLKRERQQLVVQKNKGDKTLEEKDRALRLLEERNRINEEALRAQQLRAENEKQVIIRKKDTEAEAAKQRAERLQAQLAEADRLREAERKRQQTAVEQLNTQITRLKKDVNTNQNELVRYTEEKTDFERLLDKAKKDFADKQKALQAEIEKAKRENDLLIENSNRVREDNDSLNKQLVRAREEVGPVVEETQRLLLERTTELTESEREKNALQDQLFIVTRSVTLTKEEEERAKRERDEAIREQEAIEASSSIVRATLEETRKQLRLEKERADESEEKELATITRLESTLSEADTLRFENERIKNMLDRESQSLEKLREEKRNADRKILLIQGELDEVRTNNELLINNVSDTEAKNRITIAESSLASAQSNINRLETELANRERELDRARRDALAVQKREQEDAQAISIKSKSASQLKTQNAELTKTLRETEEALRRVRLYNYETGKINSLPVGSFNPSLDSQRELLIMPQSTKTELEQALQARKRLETLDLYNGRGNTNLVRADPSLVGNYIVLRTTDLTRLEKLANNKQPISKVGGGGDGIQKLSRRPALSLGASVDALTHIGALNQLAWQARLDSLRDTASEYEMQVHFMTGDPLLEPVDQLNFIDHNVHVVADPTLDAEADGDSFFGINLTTPESLAERTFLSYGTLTKDGIYADGMLKITVTDKKTGGIVQEKELTYAFADLEEQPYNTRVILRPDVDVVMYARDVGGDTYILESLLFRAK